MDFGAYSSSYPTVLPSGESTIKNQTVNNGTPLFAYLHLLDKVYYFIAHHRTDLLSTDGSDRS